MKATFLIEDLFKIGDSNIVPVGSIKRGVLSVGMKTEVMGKTMKVQSIEIKHKKVTEAQTGESIGIFLENGDYDILKNYIKQEIIFSDKNNY